MSGFEKILAELSRSQNDHVTLAVKYRKFQISQLTKFLKDNQEGLIDALKSDFVTEFGAKQEVLKVIESAQKALGSVECWMKDKKVSTEWNLMHLLDKASIHYEPLGVVLIIGSWNVPLMTLVDPILGAIAAGCCVVAKPSEICSNTANFVARNLPGYMDPATFLLVSGGAEETKYLIDCFQWDLIFFTGSERVGRLIYQQAAAKLIPVVLELGGKSPAFVLENCGASLQLAADRLIWAKMIKAGQICISPDYLLVDEAIYEKFLGCLLNACNRMCPGKSKDLDQIVTEQHWDRLSGLLETGGGTRIFEGPRSREDRYFGLTLVSGPSLGSALMREEVFGPILPIIKVRNHKDGIDFVNRGPKPLMVYAFGKDKKSIAAIKSCTRSGNFMANDCILSFLRTKTTFICVTLMFYVVEELPFGGVGSSGMGAYHGRHSFETFSHAKSCLERGLNLGWLDQALRFPPMTPTKMKRLFRVAHRSSKILKGISLILAFMVTFTVLIVSITYYWNHQNK